MECWSEARSKEAALSEAGLGWRFWLEQERRLRDRALLDFAIDSKLRRCDLMKVRIGELVSGGRIRQRAIVVQQKTGRPVQFELLESARTSLLDWLERRSGSLDDFVFPSRMDHSDHISTRQYARLGQPATRTAIVFDLGSDRSATNVTIANGQETGWSSGFLGVILEREAALQHPLANEVYKLADHTSRCDKEVIAFLP